jgi:6-phosphogluconolactonase
MRLTLAYAFGTFAILLAAGATLRGDAPSKATNYWVYFGTYTGKDSKGIYRAEFDAQSGKLSNLALAGEVASPSFLAIRSDGKFLYAVGEISNFGGKKEGAVNAFAIDPKTGDLTLLNQQPSGGSGPCHVVLDRTGKHVLVANYGGGSVASLPIGDDGKLGPPASVIQHRGKSVNPSRQQGPHAHSINIDASNRIVAAADLGLDQVLLYRFDATTGKLTPNDPPHAAVAPGAGPRHFAFHPTSPYAYVINELGNTVTVFDFDAGKGSLTSKQDITTLPADWTKASYTAEVVAHPNGKFLYGSNRGHNSIAAFRIDSLSGKLTLVGIQGEGIKTPRNFAIDPTGKFLLVGNQDSNSIAVFAIDQTTGALTPAGSPFAVPMPVCVRFLAKP